MKLIGLMGVAGAGKSTVAEHLATAHDYIRLSFATPLKEMLRIFNLPSANLYGNLKSEPLDCFGGKSTREAMQTLGTEWGRALYSDIWVHIMERRIQDFEGFARPLVIDDMRFANEVSMVKRLGGEVWIVRRREAELQHHQHMSEQGWLEVMRERAYSVMFSNDSTIPTLQAKIDIILGVQHA